MRVPHAVVGDVPDAFVPPTIRISGQATPFGSDGSVALDSVELRDLANQAIPAEIAFDPAAGAFELVIGTNGRPVDGYLLVTPNDPSLRPTQEYFPSPLDRDLEVQIPLIDETTAGTIRQACGGTSTADGVVFVIGALAADQTPLGGARITTSPEGEYCTSSLQPGTVSAADGLVFAVGVPRVETLVTVTSGDRVGQRFVTPQFDLGAMFVPVRAP